MDEYFVGSVADLISNKSTVKTQSKKEKLKLKKKEQTQVIVKETDDKIDKSSLGALQTKNNKKSALHLSGGNYSESIKSKKIITESEPVKWAKKRKKSFAAQAEDAGENQETPKEKKVKKDLIDFHHVPTDSEGEEKDENIKRNLKENRKATSKDVYKDFKENTVFVGNIPIDYNKQKICKVFSKFGEIQNARIRCVPIADINMSKKVAAIKRKFNPKRNSLVAYVKFKSQESVNAALEANGMVVDGHHLRVDLAEEDQNRDNNKAVFVGGLPFDIEDDELWNFFEKCGKIKSVRVIRDSQTSMGKGFGYVNFDSSAAVELALQLNGLELKKRTINVKRCVKSRNKNKLNSFGKKKSEEMANQLLCKRGKKFKEEKKKMKKNKNQPSANFQGRVANMKQKKKKKLTKAALRQRKIVKILGAS